MAEKIVSPGVFTKENEVSFLAQGIGNIGAVVIGPFKKGPAFLPIVVNTQSEFEEIFGTPDGTYYSGYTVQNYLREAGTVTIVKVGHVGGYKHETPLGITVSGSSGVKLISSLLSTTTANESVGFSTSTIESVASASVFSIEVTGSTAISASVLPTAGNDIVDVFGSGVTGNKSVYAYNYFENAATTDTIISAGGSVELVELETQDFAYDSTIASTPWIQSQLISGERQPLFRFHSLGFGNVYNKEYKVGISNIKFNIYSDFPSFSITLRDYDDTDKRKTVKETFNNVNLNPTSPNYLPKIVGDINTTIDASGKISEVGDYPSRSKYVRVEVAVGFSDTAVPYAHGAYTNPIFVGGDEAIVPAVIFTTGSASNTLSTRTKFSGIDLETNVIKIDNNNYLSPIPNGAETGSNTSFNLDTILSLDTPSEAETSADVNKRQFIVAFQGGFDGVSPTVSIDKGVAMEAGTSQGFDLSSSTSSGSVAYKQAINAISNPDDYDINLVAAPGIIRRLHPAVFDTIVEMVESREDAFFIGDVTAINDSIDLAVEQGAAVDSNYAATYYPWVKVIDANTNKLTSVPPSVLMPAIYASNDAIAAEWWAPAGLNRGGIVGAVSVLNRLTHAERDTLYEGKINPIATFPGEGIVAFGQKTLQEQPSALDRINVRRLLIKVKKFIASTSRYLIFEQNTATTRNKFTNTVNPYLEGIQQRQGLYTFKVVMDETNNTPDVIDRNIMAGQIFLQPTKTAEFIILDFSIMPTGAAFTG